MMNVNNRLAKRKQIQFGKDLKPFPKKWEPLLKNNNQWFLTDNQLSLFVSKTTAGCEKTHFYPLPFTYANHSGVAINEIGKYDNLTSYGPMLKLGSADVKGEFLPYAITKAISANRNKIKERIAVAQNTFVIEWQISNLHSALLEYGLPHFNADCSEIKNGFFISVEGQVFVAMSILGCEIRNIDIEQKPFSLSAELHFRKNRRVYVVCSCGYSKASVLKAHREASLKPETVFESAHKMWDDYFRKVVPHFSCSDTQLEQLYYYQAYATRANLYDIPYEPFTHPYTSPWKSGAKWQWSWNTPMNSVTEKWLNDKSLAAGGIELLCDNGGALNAGTYLRPVRNVSKLRNIHDMNVKLGELHKKTSLYDPVTMSTMPHSMPSGLLAGWELFLCSGDAKFLNRLLDIMIEAERHLSKYELPNGLCMTSFVDEYDYSLRLKPYIKGFAKGDPAMMTKMDTPFIPIDYNCYLCGLREKILETAQFLSRKVNRDQLTKKSTLLKTAINKYLWSENDGFYYDADPRTMKHSGIKCIGGIAGPLYNGIADQRQASRIVNEHLTNPREFGTPYPCPSISIDTMDIDPSLFTYGGDCLITSGIWFTVEGLIRYEYLDLAVSYILKTIEMLVQNGPNSAYSYNCFTGRHNHDDPFVENHVLAAQSLITTDLICKYIIGFVPDKGGNFKMLPLALKKSGISYYSFGPYKFCEKEILIKYNNGQHEIIIK